MKLLTIALISLFTQVGLSATNLKQTDLLVSQPPTIAQLETAREILAEAIEAKRNGDTELFLNKLNKAKEYQKYRQVKQTFKAAFITQYDDTKINYFSSDEIGYEVNIETTCYVGDIDEAVSLLSVAIENKKIGSDELWYENPIKSGKKILLDLVDGPNDLRDPVEVKACK